MNILVLINPAAGFHSRELWHAGFRRRLETVPPGIRIFVEHTVLGGIKDQIRKMAPKVDRIVVVGGDGTVGAVINGVSELNLPYPVGVIPLGTGNDMARSLGLFENRFWTVDEAYRYVTSDSLKTTPVDVWSLNGDVTFNNYCSLGMDAKIVRGFSRIRSRLQPYPFGAQKGVYFAVYILVWLSNIGYRAPRGGEIEWTGPEGVERAYRFRAPRVITLTNIPYYAAGALMSPEARLGDGILEVTVFPHLRRYAELMAMRIPAFAHMGIQSRWRRIRAKKLKIRLPRPVCVQADGEDLGEPIESARTLSVSPLDRVSVLTPANE